MRRAKTGARAIGEALVYFGAQTRAVAFWSMLAAVGMVVYQVGHDRSAPFRLIDQQPVMLRAGAPAMIDVQVWRDPDRQCATTFSRTLIDARGAQHEITPMTYRSADAIRKMQDLTPGRARFPVLVPPLWSGDREDPGVAQGAGELVVELAYACNQAQAVLAPIRTRAVVPVVIVP